MTLPIDANYRSNERLGKDQIQSLMAINYPSYRQLVDGPRATLPLFFPAISGVTDRIYVIHKDPELPTLLQEHAQRRTMQGA